jgi:glutathione S-transferase
LFPQDGAARFTALRRQALGDGFLDLLVLTRNERLRAQPSQPHLASAAARTAAVLASLEREADALAASAFSIGHIAIGCALSYLDFRFAEQEWRKPHPRLAAWHAGFAARASVQATLAVDDS